jgi:hypothetical protein
MPRIKNLAALAAAVQAGRTYARNNPDKAGRYVDQAASFLDKQTKGRYSGHIHGVVGKVKSAAGLPDTSRHSGTGNGSVQGYEANAGYGRHQGYGETTPPVTPSSTTPPSTGPSRGEPYPGSRDL